MQQTLFDAPEPDRPARAEPAVGPSRDATVREAGFWDDAAVISRYTREQAVADGVLVDVTKTAREAGFKDPVALTAAVHSDVRDIPPSKKGIQDHEGRLWDLLCVCLSSVKAGASCRQEPPLFATLVMHIGRRRNYRAKILIGPGDGDELVLTIARPDED